MATKMFRSLVPLAARQARTAGRKPAFLAEPSRGVHNKRHLPIRLPWSRRSPFNDIFNDSFFDIARLDNQFRDMLARMERMMSPSQMYYLRPRMEEMGKSEDVQVKYDKSGYEVKVDVQKFGPEELTVKVSDADNVLVVAGKHEAKVDEHGYITREFRREFTLPEDVEIESLKSRITEDGYLVVEGRVKEAEQAKERTISIEKPSKTATES